MTDTKQPTEEQFETALTEHHYDAYSMLKWGEGMIGLGALRKLFQTGYALGAAADPWKSVHEELPAGGAFVLCYFKKTGNQVVCYYNPPALVRGPTFMCDGNETVPDYWKPLDLPAEENCNADLH